MSRKVQRHKVSRKHIVRNRAPRKYYKSGNKFFIPIEISKLAPKEYRGNLIMLQFGHKPTKPEIKIKLKEFYELHPELFYHKF